MSGSRAVLVLTSHARFGDSDRPTGFWYEELAAPYHVLTNAGVEVTLASPAGGQPPVDPASLIPAAVTDAVDRFRADPDAVARLAATVPLAGLDDSAFDSVVLVGGHGTMWDFPANPPLADLLTAVLSRGGTVGAVCHGAAALVDLQTAGRSVVDGRQLTAFSDSEEELVAATGLVPFSLEQRLRALGARYAAGQPFAPHVLRDGQLVTGQNPASSTRVAELVADAVRPARTAPTRP